MKKLVVFSVLCALMAIYSVYGAVTGQVENGMSAAAVFALAALVLAWRASKKAKKKKPASKPIQTAPASAAPAQATAQPAAKSYKTAYKGTVVGVTYEGRQKVLERLVNKEMEGETLTFELEESEYKGEPSIKVMAGTMDEGTMKQIGYVAAGDVARVLPYVGTAYVDGRIYGGEDGKNYGAAIEVFVAE